MAFGFEKQLTWCSFEQTNCTIRHHATENKVPDTRTTMAKRPLSSCRTVENNIDGCLETLKSKLDSAFLYSERTNQYFVFFQYIVLFVIDLWFEQLYTHHFVWFYWWFFWYEIKHNDLRYLPGESHKKVMVNDIIIIGKYVIYQRTGIFSHSCWSVDNRY